MFSNHSGVTDVGALLRSSLNSTSDSAPFCGSHNKTIGQNQCHNVTVGRMPRAPVGSGLRTSSPLLPSRHASPPIEFIHTTPTLTLNSSAMMLPSNNDYSCSSAFAALSIESGTAPTLLHHSDFSGAKNMPAIMRLRGNSSRNIATAATNTQFRASTGSIATSSSVLESRSASIDLNVANNTPTASSSNPLFKTNLCREHSLSGTCPFGRRCHFAHGESELRPVPPEFDTAVSHRAGSSALSEQVYKTELCHIFMQLNACRYGVRCHFAHGFDELRPRWSTANKSTTRVGKCIQFENSGTCRFGSRCRFLHGNKVPSQSNAGNSSGGGGGGGATAGNIQTKSEERVTYGSNVPAATDLAAFMPQQLTIWNNSNIAS